MPLQLKHATKAQFLTRLREVYRDAEGIEAGRIAARMVRLITDGDLTNAEIQAYFNLSGVQIAQFKPRIQTAATRYNDMLTARGE